MKEKSLRYKAKLLLGCILFLSLQGLYSQTWISPALNGSTLTTGTTYYMYNLGSNGYLSRGGFWRTQAVVSASPTANASTTIIKWTSTNTSGSIWTFQYNSAGANVANNFLFAANATSTDGSVFTDNTTNNTWNVVATDATNNIYSIQVISSYGGYVATQYLGTEANTESGNLTTQTGGSGTFNTVRYNRASSSYTQWKFVSQADLDLYNAKVLLDRYMTYAKNRGLDITSYITTYNSGNTTNINTAATTLLTTLGRTTISFSNYSFEDATALNYWTNPGVFAKQTNVPGMGWTKDGSAYAEKYTASAYGTNGNGTKGYLAAGTITQTVSGLSNGLYELVVSGHAVQQAGANPLHTGAFITAGASTTEVAAGKDYSIENINVTSGSLAIGYSLVAPITCNWTGFDNYRLYYYGAIVPNIYISKSSIDLSPPPYQTTFDIGGNNLTNDITITPPAHITLTGTNVTNNGNGTYTIAVANANSAVITVTATWDNVATTSGNIQFVSSGATTKNIAVTANLDPIVTTASSVVFGRSLQATFNVTGNGLTDVITPSGTGMVFSPTTLASNSVNATLAVTATGTSAAGNITLSSTNSGGAVSKTVAYTFTTPVITLSQLSMPIGNNSNTVNTVSLTSNSDFGDHIRVTPSAGFTVSTTDITPAQFSSGSGVVGVNVSTTATQGTAGTVTFDYTRDGGSTYITLATLNVTACTPYYIKNSAASTVIGSAGAAPQLKNRIVDNSQLFYTFPSGNGSYYYLWQASSGNVLKKLNTYDVTLGAIDANSYWTLTDKGAGVYSITSSVKTDLGTNALSDGSSLYCDKVYPANNTGWNLINYYTDPFITVVPGTLAFDDLNPTGSFVVYSGNLINDINITPPAGIVVSPATISMGSANNVTVTVTYDGTTSNISGNIVLTSGSATQNVSVIATKNTDCFTPLYSSGNLVTDPYLNSLTAYSGSWGAGATINTDLTKVYCGLKSGKVTGTRAGSITYPLNGKWAVNTGYHVRAKVMVDAGTFNFNVSGWSGTSADIVNTYTVNAGVWQTVDFKFTTGASLTSANQYFYFNNYTSNTTGTGYVDNIEMYNIPLITATAGTNGTVSGAGPFDVGESVTLVATPNTGYHFVNWTENGTEVSQSATYTFSASANRTLVANFAPNAVIVSSDTNASTLINCTTCDITVNTGNTLTVDATKTFNSVTIAPGAKLTIASGNTLSTALTLQSSSTATATFVDSDPIGSTINATVQQYLPQGRNWYVGIPFTTASGVGASALTDTGTGTTVSYYDEPSSVWVNNYTGTLTRGVGYVAVSNPADGSATNNMTFSGTLNTGLVSVSLTRKGATKAGFNLVANPYPSYLNAMAAINANANMENTIWYRTRSASAYYFETVNTTSGVGTNNAGTGTVTGYVPPMQAFWVRTTTDNNSITFTNAMRAHAGNTTLTDGQTVVPTTLLKTRAVNNSLSQMLRLKVSNGTNSDETVIYTNDNALNGYDAYDSQKMTNNSASIPELFTTADNNSLAINGINSVQPNMEIPVGFFTKESNTFSIKATQISNLDATNIVLRDNLLQTEQVLTDTTTAYSFSSDATTSANRFSIVFKSGSIATGINAPDSQYSVSVFTNKNGQIVLDYPSGLVNNCRATVYNAIGQVQEIVELTGTRAVFRKTVPGIYVVALISNGKTIINKVVVDK